jgi:hypothetical protein
MNNQRFKQLIQYKAALDSEWKRKNHLSVQEDTYDTTLRQVKLDSFKVFRNSSGEHKLVDTLEEGKPCFSELFGSVFGGVFK